MIISMIMTTRTTAKGWLTHLNTALKSNTIPNPNDKIKIGTQKRSKSDRWWDVIVLDESSKWPDKERMGRKRKERNMG